MCFPLQVLAVWERMWAARLAVSVHMPVFVAYCILHHYK